ncbi:MAG: hypothetical protein R3Y36_06950 [Spirochaetales bacterium]
MLLLFLCVSVYSLFSEHMFPVTDKRIVPALMGFFVAVIYSFIELFFTSAYYLAPYSFFANYRYFFTFEVIIPCFLCFTIMFLFVRKQENRFFALYFMILGFYTVYFPARVLNRNILFDNYILFVKPVIYVAMFW